MQEVVQESELDQVALRSLGLVKDHQESEEHAPDQRLCDARCQAIRQQQQQHGRHGRSRRPLVLPISLHERWYLLFDAIPDHDHHSRLHNSAHLRE